MIEKVLVKKPAVTIAKIIKIKKKNPIFMPLEFIENLKPEDTVKRWAVMILDPLTKIIRTIPTKSPTVIKLYIEYYSMKNLLEELGEVLVRYKISTLYSYFVCSCPDHPYVGYIDSTDSPISNDQLKSELYSITDVYNVQITDLSFEEDIPFVNLLKEDHVKGEERTENA